MKAKELKVVLTGAKKLESDKDIGITVLTTAHKALCKQEYRQNKEITKFRNNILIIESKLEPIIKKRKALEKSIKLLEKK